MEKHDFEKVWFAIKKTAAQIIEVDKDLKFNDECSEKILAEYEKLEERCKKQFFINGKAATLDRHKVGSCFAGAIIKVKPITFLESDENEHVRVSYVANETLAVLISLNIVDSYRDVEFKNGFIFPETDNDNYINWLCTALYEAGSEGCFNVLMFSNILFLLEKYTEKV